MQLFPGCVYGKIKVVVVDSTREVLIRVLIRVKGALIQRALTPTLSDFIKQYKFSLKTAKITKPKMHILIESVHVEFACCFTDLYQNRPHAWWINDLCYLYSQYKILGIAVLFSSRSCGHNSKMCLWIHGFLVSYLLLYHAIGPSVVFILVKMFVKEGNRKHAFWYQGMLKQTLSIVVISLLLLFVYQHSSISINGSFGHIVWKKHIHIQCTFKNIGGQNKFIHLWFLKQFPVGLNLHFKANIIMRYCYEIKVNGRNTLHMKISLRDEKFIKTISVIMMIMNRTVKTNTTYTRLFSDNTLLIIVTISSTFSFFSFVLSYKVHEQHHREDYQN